MKRFCFIVVIFNIWISQISTKKTLKRTTPMNEETTDYYYDKINVKIRDENGKPVDNVYYHHPERMYEIPRLAETYDEVYDDENAATEARRRIFEAAGARFTPLFEMWRSDKRKKEDIRDLK